MLKSEMQHQFWITKKTVQRKLGSKEDDHIISSDAELDAKIEIYKSISDTSAELSKIIDQYQERLCILSQEECVFGRFLKEAGKRSKTTGPSITNTGKAVSFSGQQRMCVRVPLLRLQHEVEVFRSRAVLDTQATIQAMEKERTEYRAALSWMKSASAELDPDTGKGLDKFRMAQTHVRAAKHNFDALSLNSIQKIDLLSAARCNMYSHALVSYMSELKQFAQKTANTFEAIAKSLLHKPKYDFYILKELTQNEGQQQGASDSYGKVTDLVDADKDQSLFFADEYVDERKERKTGETDERPTSTILTTSNTENGPDDGILIELSQQVDEILRSTTPSPHTIDGNLIESFDLVTQPPASDNSPKSNNINTSNNNNNNEHHDDHHTNGFWTKLFQQNQNRNQHTPNHQQQQQPQQASRMEVGGDRDTDRPSDNSKQRQFKMPTTTAAAKTNPWLDLFAELDPLANPEAFDRKLNAGRQNFQQT